MGMSHIFLRTGLATCDGPKQGWWCWPACNGGADLVFCRCSRALESLDAKWLQHVDAVIAEAKAPRMKL